MRPHWLAVAVLFLVAGAWGATFTVVKNILGQIAPEPFIFWRFITAGAILCGIAIARGRLHRVALLPGLVLGTLVFSGYWAQTRGLIFISPSRSAFLTGLYVVVVPFWDRLIYRAHVSAKAWAGSVLALIGTGFLIGGFAARPSWADLLTIFCAVCFGLHVVLSARYSARTSATGLAAVQVLVVGLAAAPFALAQPAPRASAQVVIVILFTAIVTTALAFVALMWGQARVSATEAAVILAFEPVAASLTSIVWDREPLTLTFIAGALLILAAMILSQMTETPEQLSSRA